MKTIRKIQLRMTRVPLADHVASESEAHYGAKLVTPAAVIRAATAILEDEAQECILVFLLDIKNRILGYQEAHRGGLDTCGVDPRVIFRAAVVAGATAIVAVHNHPSGDLTPSAADNTLTARLKAAGELLGVQVLDHLIVGEAGAYYSYAEHGGI